MPITLLSIPSSLSFRMTTSTLTQFKQLVLSNLRPVACQDHLGSCSIKELL